jgi:CRISPR-associated endonuclease/helicase Cas3
MLHDLGKCNVGFQVRRNPDAANTTGHVTETAALLYDYDLSAKATDALGLDAMASWFDTSNGCGRMLLAAIFHHGKPAYKHDIGDSNQIDRLKRHWQPRDGIDPFVGLRELGATARNTFPSAFTENAPPIPVTIELEHRFAGLVMLADWLGSHREAFFPFGLPRVRGDQPCHTAMLTEQPQPPPRTRGSTPRWVVVIDGVDATLG